MRGFVSVLLAGCAWCGPLSAAEITVHAAASLTEALEEIATGYERASGDRVLLNLGASSILARQIAAGAPADVFLSADEAKMDALAEKGLLAPGTRRTLLTNSLVLIVPETAGAWPQTAADLARPEFKKIALAEPGTVPAGIYAREFLQREQLWEKLRDRIIPLENVRSVLAAVESGNVAAGFVYNTDALLAKKARVALEIPASAGPKISYALAVLQSSRAPAAARNFAGYLASPPAQKIFAQFGFAPAP